MSKYSEELKTFTNEKLMSVYSGNKGLKTFFKIFFWIMLGCTVLFSAFLIFTHESIFIIFVVVSIGLVFFFKWSLRVQDSGIMECEEEMQRRKLPQHFIEKAKKESKDAAVRFGCIAIIFVIIIIIIGACSISSVSKKHQYDDVFEKDPNKWSDDEKDYVNDLFDYIKENN